MDVIFCYGPNDLHRSSLFWGKLNIIARKWGLLSDGEYFDVIQFPSMLKGLAWIISSMGAFID